MNRKCANCDLVHFSNETLCRRCGSELASAESFQKSAASSDDLGAKLDAGAIWFFKRFATALGVALVLLALMYFSMLQTAKPLSADEQQQITAAVNLLDERGFKTEAFWLRHSSFRSNDNWFNALVGHNDAYAATNFPFQIVTVYENFFTLSTDDRERAAVLLHEAQHLQGAGEQRAYEYVWKNRLKLDWTRRNYPHSKIYDNVLTSTAQIAPGLFQCGGNLDSDCTQ